MCLFYNITRKFLSVYAYHLQVFLWLVPVSPAVLCCPFSLAAYCAVAFLPDYLSPSIRNHLNWFFLSLTLFNLFNRLLSIEPRFVSFNWWISDWLCCNLLVDKYRNQSMRQRKRERQRDKYEQRQLGICMQAYFLCISYLYFRRFSVFCFCFIFWYFVFPQNDPNLSFSLTWTPVAIELWLDPR